MRFAMKRTWKVSSSVYRSRFETPARVAISSVLGEAVWRTEQYWSRERLVPQSTRRRASVAALANAPHQLEAVGGD
jgi:hypothetical protein